MHCWDREEVVLIEFGFASFNAQGGCEDVTRLQLTNLEARPE